MRAALLILLAVAVATAPVLARADDLPRAGPEVVAEEVVGLDEGKPAPFTGLLLTEERFNLYVGQQERAEKAEAEKATVEKQRNEAVLDAETCKARCPEDGSADGKRKFWLGATTGAVVATLVLGAIAYGIVEAAKLLNK